MIFYVSGSREETLLQKALAKAFAECVNADESERYAKMLARALKCIELQSHHDGKRKAPAQKSED